MSEWDCECVCHLPVLAGYETGAEYDGCDRDVTCCQVGARISRVRLEDVDGVVWMYG